MRLSSVQNDRTRIACHNPLRKTFENSLKRLVFIFVMIVWYANLPDASDRSLLDCSSGKGS